MWRLLFLMLISLITCFSEANTVRLPYSSATLLNEYETIKPQQSFWVALKIQTEPGWHVYWKNPGDSGLPPTIKWMLPKNVKTDPISWLPPEKIKVAHLMNFGYEGITYFPVKISNHSKKTRGKFKLSADVRWLVCKENCIPQRASLKTTVIIADKAIESADHEALNQQLDHLASIYPLNAKVTVKEKLITIYFKKAEMNHPNIDSLFFFPEEEGLIENAAEQIWSYEGPYLKLTLKRGFSNPEVSFKGLLAVQRKLTKDYFQVSAEIVPMPPYELSEESAMKSQRNIWVILFLAFLGGLILNAMPCVFPILSLKLLAIFSKSHNDLKIIRAQGVAYSVGVIFSFLFLAAFLLLLKQAGQSIGWGFQLQSPAFVMLLLFILFLVGLNLSGFFEVPWMVDDSKFADRSGYFSSFMTGVLAVLVATPCTAPFMATALGYALTESGIYALYIFFMMAVGFASPFLFLSFFPYLLHYLPKPGKWMEILREFLAFPIYLSCVWLLWILAQQVSINQLGAVLLALVLIVFWIWCEKHAKESQLRWRILIRFIFTLLMSSLLLIYVLPHTKIHKNKQYSVSTLNALLKQKTPVFVYATASWCITCKVNELLVLSKPAIQNAFAQKKVTVLKADWTNQDETVTHFLETFKRSGVPLYVFYPKQGTPLVLPQLLTKAIVLEAIGMEQK